MSAYPDLPNPDLLDRIPLHARMVLDVGCATGSLGAIYRRVNPRARLLGIDLDAEAAAIAATRLDAVVVGDVEADPAPFPDLAGLDCIVYGDVLEHLREPWSLLKRHAALLDDDGTMLICVPNVEHWSFAARLLVGNWDYEPSGLLDATHLRWFTLASMLRGFEAIGLVPCDVHPRVFEPERADAFIDKIRPGLEAIGIDPAEYRGRATPLQYVWRVRKRNRELLTIAANMLRPVGGVSHTRVVHPLRALATDPNVAVRLVQDNVVSAPPGETPRVFVLHRPVLAGEPAAAMLRAMIRSGWVIVTEFDDHPDFFEAMRREDLYTFRGVHAVQTSTPTLGAVLRARNPETAVFPNAIRALPDVRNFTDPEHITLFFGALNREQDWEPYLPVLNAVSAILGDRLRFSIVHDQALFDGLESPRKVFTPTCDYDTYLNLLGACELSFMPLADTPFNRAKSDLKFIEAAACRVCALASPVVYGDTLEDGRTGMLFRSPEELRTRLLRACAMPDIARGIADRARDYVAAERMLAYQVADRVAWYRDLWARREALTQALFARAPDLQAEPGPAP